MKVPFVNYPAQYKKIKPEIDKAVQSCLERGDLILRSDVSEFEEKLAKFVGVKYAIGVNSGTDALILSLKAIGIMPGDEVITSAYTFWATIEAIKHAGGIPVLADITEDLLIDTDDIVRKITPRTKAIIPVHIGGALCDMEKIKEIASNHNLDIIEDAAQGLGIKGVGEIGMTSCFSFYPAKILGGYGDGGAVITDRWEIADRVRLLRDHCRSKIGITGYGYNSRLDNIQAAILNVKIKYLPEYIKRRQEIAAMYNKGLKDIFPKLPLSETYQEYNLRVFRRDGLVKHLKEKGIETLIGSYDFSPFYIHSLIGANFSNKTILRLPICPELTNEQVEYVIKSIKEFYAEIK